MDVDTKNGRRTVLEESDIRNLVRLMGYVSGLDVDLAQKRQLILSGLAQLIQCSGWAWSLTEQSRSGTIQLDAMSGGDTKMLPSDAKPLLPKGSKSRRARGARLGSIATGQKTQTLSICELAGNTASRLLFARPAGSPPFSSREEEMVHIVAEELAWLHELNPVCTPLESSIHLSPRERQICSLLAEGLSSKSIAERLSISSHTVHDYIKAIYRTFGIRSRAEAIRHFALLRHQ